MPVVFASSDSGTLMLGITKYSLLSSQNPDTYYDIYVLEDQMTEQHKAKVRAAVEGFECGLQFIGIHDLLSQKIIQHDSRRVPPTAYSRLFLTSLLPDEKRVLYLDIDLLICKDLKELYLQDL